MKRIFAFLLALVALAASAQVPIYTRPQGASSISGGSAPGGTNNSVPFINPAGSWNQDNPNFTYTIGTTTLTAPTITAGTKFLAPATGPGYAFSGASPAGITGLTFNSSANGILEFNANNSIKAWVHGNNVLGLASTTSLGWGAESAEDTFLVRDGAANTIAQKNSTNAQVNRLYFSTTGPVYSQRTARTAGELRTGVGGAMQLSTAQTTAPTCTTNCGSPGNVCVGSDSDMICTMGTTPASGVVINFNGSWPAAPACVVQMALAGMVVGKQVLTAATTQTTITLVTNGTAPSTSDKYAIICRGVS